jgi:spermidine synthase
MAYEILFAQIMAILFGSTTMYYAATIGLYLFSLGLGAIIYLRSCSVGNPRLLIGVEFSLAFLGTTSPIILLLLAGLLPAAVHSTLSPALVFGFLFIATIGILTGIELPCLMDLAGNSQSNSIQVLSWDLFGTFIGGPLVLFILYPTIGIIPAAATLGILNGVAALCLIPLVGMNKGIALALVLLCLVTALILIFSSPITIWLTELVF